MIARLVGTVVYRAAGYVIIDVHGVGYKVSFPETVAQTVSGDVTVYTYEVQRDDGRELFGFMATNALELFEQLIGVSGVGPKTAQKITCAGSVEQVTSAIMRGDLAFFGGISGVGKKTAQKIILELKGVLAEEETIGGSSEASEALLAMGYTRKQATEALEGVEGDTEEQIRTALKRLSR